jgi:hypothetical protein
VVTLEGTEFADLDTDEGEAEDLEGASSSSLGLRSKEISTVEVVIVVVGGVYLKSKRGWGASTGLSTCASLNNGVRLKANGGYWMSWLFALMFAKRCSEATEWYVFGS